MENCRRSRVRFAWLWILSVCAGCAADPGDFPNAEDATATNVVYWYETNQAGQSELRSETRSAAQIERLLSIRRSLRGKSADVRGRILAGAGLDGVLSTFIKKNADSCFTDTTTILFNGEHGFWFCVVHTGTPDPASKPKLIPFQPVSYQDSDTYHFVLCKTPDPEPDVNCCRYANGTNGSHTWRYFPPDLAEGPLKLPGDVWYVDGQHELPRLVENCGNQ
jgi:hypothetical protein